MAPQACFNGHPKNAPVGPQEARGGPSLKPGLPGTALAAGSGDVRAQVRRAYSSTDAAAKQSNDAWVWVKPQSPSAWRSQFAFAKQA